jgi:hypothetical protein
MEYEHVTEKPSPVDLFGHGAGDPEVHGHYPGDPDTKDCRLCNTTKPKHATPSVYRKKHWSEESSYSVRRATPARDYGDNNPADPEQNWEHK